MPTIRTRPVIHPGEILSEEFLKPLGISQYRLAVHIGVQPTRIGQIVSGKRAITADTAVRLSAALDTSPDFWLNLQKRHDLEIAQENLGALTQQITPLHVAA